MLKPGDEGRGSVGVGVVLAPGKSAEMLLDGCSCCFMVTSGKLWDRLIFGYPFLYSVMVVLTKSIEVLINHSI